MCDVVVVSVPWIPRRFSAESSAIDVQVQLAGLASARALPHLRAWNVVLHTHAHVGCTFPQSLHTVPHGECAVHLPPPRPAGIAPLEDGPSARLREGATLAGEVFGLLPFLKSGALVERERTGSGSDRGLLESSAGPNGSRSTTASSSFANGSTISFIRGSCRLP